MYQSAIVSWNQVIKRELKYAQLYTMQVLMVLDNTYMPLPGQSVIIIYSSISRPRGSTLKVVRPSQNNISWSGSTLTIERHGQT